MTASFRRLGLNQNSEGYYMMLYVYIIYNVWYIYICINTQDKTSICTSEFGGQGRRAQYFATSP